MALAWKTRGFKPTLQTTCYTVTNSVYTTHIDQFSRTCCYFIVIYSCFYPQSPEVKPWVFRWTFYGTVDCGSCTDYVFLLYFTQTITYENEQIVTINSYWASIHTCVLGLDQSVSNAFIFSLTPGHELISLMQSKWEEMCREHIKWYFQYRNSTEFSLCWMYETAVIQLTMGLGELTVNCCKIKFKPAIQDATW